VVGDGGRGENLVSSKNECKSYQFLQAIVGVKRSLKIYCFKSGATSFGPSVTFKCFLVVYLSMFINEGKAHI
jgi:hypothetical protein